MIFDRKQIVRRYGKNPIITTADLPCRSNSVFNSGCIKRDGRYVMMLRIEDVDGAQHFRMAYSCDGIAFDVCGHPVIIPDSEDMERFELLRYDPRITPLDGAFYVTYAAHGAKGVRICLVQTDDFEKFRRIGYISEPDNRNGVLFPEKIQGRYVRLDRPTMAHGQGGKGDMWLSYSPDLIHWGDHKLVAETRPERWDGHKLGAGPAPIKTPEGWLLLYHGVYERCNGLIYRCGVMLLDLEKPEKVLARSHGYILGPQEPYERIGDVPNVVFVTGNVLEDDGTVKLYYGAADTVMCLAFARLTDLIDAAWNR
ncbi:MAG: glycoside hydrolase family 130 protein [Planctomycetes bacterium]|nr:glycoside hydrolase family 130 protein [Planctomycetota bacterium]